VRADSAIMGAGGDMLRVGKDHGAIAPPTPPISMNTPTTFRMATEETLKNYAGASDIPGPGTDGMFGVQSLGDTKLESPAPPEATSRENLKQEDVDERINSLEGRRRSTLKPRQLSHDNLVDAAEQNSEERARSPTSQRRCMPSPPPSMSHSLTSLSLDSQAPLSSLPSSPKSYSNRSLRPSDDDSMDDGGSQAVVSSSEDDVDLPSDLQKSAPQLVMPSIKMPSRRPFTERGKNFGRLKVLIAGDSGTGFMPI